MKKKTVLTVIFAFAAIISAVILSSAAINKLSGNVTAKNGEIREYIEDGFIAVAEYNSTDSIKISTGTSLWAKDTDSFAPEAEFIFSEYGNADEYLRQGDDDRVYMSGTYDNSALVFYVRETDDEEHKLLIGIENIDESMFFADIQSQKYARVRLGIAVNDKSKWENLQINDTDSPVQINYRNCFYDAEKDAYQVVIRVDNGMAAFSVIELTGLEILNVEGSGKNLYYQDGVLMTADGKEADSAEYANFTETEKLMKTADVLPSEAYIALLKSFLQSVAAQMQKIIDAFILLFGQGGIK